MKIVTWAAILFGTPSVILGYVLNMANWKNDVLFLFGIFFWSVMIVFGAIRKYDEMRIRRRQMKRELKNDEYEEKIRNLYGPGEDTHRLFN